MYKIKLILIFIGKFPKNFYKLFISGEKISKIVQAIVDPNGIGMFNLKMDNLGILEEYRHMFYEIKDDSICIDGGANVGLFTDLCLSLGANIHLFEPNKYLVENILERKYKNNNKVKINNLALGDKDTELVLYNNENFKNNISLTVGGSIMNNLFAKNGKEEEKVVEEKVGVIDFSQYLKNNFKLENENQPPVYLCKLDIEGAEFDVLEKMIKEETYKYCKYIVVETHARMFNDGKEKLEKLQYLIKENDIENIYLGWA